MPQVVIVKTPAAPTVKSVVEAVLNSLGDPVAHRGSTEERTQRIYHFIKQCHVELLAFDEIQHFHDTKRNNERTFFTDWLKNLIDEAHIPVVLVGMPRGETLLKISEQLARRFTRRFYVRPFSFHSKQDQLEFRGLLKNIQLLLPIDSVPLHEANLARRFIFGSAGLIDYVIKTVEEAVSLGYAHGARKIDLKVLAEAYKNAVWPDVPELLNPFNEQATLRRLDRVGEPFELWDRTRVQDKNKAGVNDE